MSGAPVTTPIHYSGGSEVMRNTQLSGPLTLWFGSVRFVWFGPVRMFRHSQQGEAVAWAWAESGGGRVVTPRARGCAEAGGGRDGRGRPASACAGLRGGRSTSNIRPGMLKL